MAMIFLKEKCGFLEVEEGTGKLTKEEFDNLIYDLTNFLVYVGEPIKATRERIGWYVIFYFLIFTALSSLLYREFIKTIINKRERYDFIFR
jgi:cytochrome c1